MQAKQFWTKAYQRNIGKMVGVCCRYVGDRAVAEDLAHEAFLKAIEKSETYRDGCALVRKGDFYGFIDLTGKEVVPVTYKKSDLIP